MTTTTIINGVIDFVEVLENSKHDYKVTVKTITGAESAFSTCEVFTIGDFVSYQIDSGFCLYFATFSNDHKIKLHAAFQSALTLHRRAQDAHQALIAHDNEISVCNGTADTKNTVNGLAGGITGVLGVPTVIAGIATANPFMMMAGCGMLGGTACAIKDTADNDAEKRIRQQRLESKRLQLQEALAQSKRADAALETLFNRFRQEALQSQIKV